MPHMISISDETFARMQSLAIPLVDTPDSIVLRALTALEAGGGGGAKPGEQASAQSFNPAVPPSLSHTTLKSAVLAGTRFERSETSWNNLMIAAIREAFARGNSKLDLALMLTVNCVIGRREDSGYKYIEDVDLSVQGQDANSAWRQTYDLASRIGLGIEVEFVWQDNPKAAMPGATGRFSVGGVI